MLSATVAQDWIGGTHVGDLARFVDAGAIGVGENVEQLAGPKVRVFVQKFQQLRIVPIERGNLFVDPLANDERVDPFGDVPGNGKPFVRSLRCSDYGHGCRVATVGARLQ